MSTLSRREFLATSLGALAAGLPAFGADTPTVEDFTFQPSTLFLTWQRDPTTTMTVQWIAAVGETSDTKVHYSTASGSGSSKPAASPTTGPTTLPTTRPTTGPTTLPASPVKATLSQTPLVRPFPMTDLKVFRAELTGLTPDTAYQFKIGKNSPTYRFRTMPAKATDAIHFISGGDCGTNNHTVANNLQAARQDPMFALIGGDLGYDNGKSVETSLQFIRNYSRTMIGPGGRLIPMLACLGNHEVDGGYDKSRKHAPFFFALFDGLFRDASYTTLDFGDYLSLVLLDSGHCAKIGGEQASWLDRTLAARADHPNVLCVNHVPAYPSYRKMDDVGKDGEQPKKGTGTDNREHWVPLFDKHRVPVVLEHHDHTFKRTKPLLDGMANDDGVLYLGDGSWGKLRSPQSPEKMAILARTSRDYHLTLHRIQGPDRFHLALDENGRVMDVSRSGQRTKGLVAMPG